MNAPIIIVGSGLAGYSLAREIRKRDKTVPLTIISQDSASFYSKPMLSNALAGNKTADSLVMKNAGQMAEELGATLLPWTRVTRIDQHARRITADDHTHTYRDLVLAVGANPFTPAIAGDAAQQVLQVNHLDDYARFQTALQNKKRVVILGAGLIGCEFANDLLHAGIEEISVVDLAPWPLSRLLPEEGGRFLADRLTAQGIQFHFGCSVKDIDHKGAELAVQLDNSQTLYTDVVLSAIGLRPDLQLAHTAGLNTQRGIVVDRYLQTSAAHIYALGDCVEVEGLILPFVLPIMHAARALAATLTGQATTLTYPAMPVVVKTPACPAVVAPPAPGVQGQWQVERNADGIKAKFVDTNGALSGFALLGNEIKERQTLTSQLPATLR